MIDWPALLAVAEKMDAPTSPEVLDLWRRGLLDERARGWHVELVAALQRAVEGSDPEALLAWLDAGLPVPGAFAPALAEALRGAAAPGRPPRLTAADDAAIRGWHDALTAGALPDPVGARQMIARALNVSERTVRRSLARTGAGQNPPSFLARE